MVKIKISICYGLCFEKLRKNGHIEWQLDMNSQIFTQTIFYTSRLGTRKIFINILTFYQRLKGGGYDILK